METQKTLNNKNNLEKKNNKARSIMFSDFKLHLKDRVIKPAQYQCKNRGQWHRFESPEINPYLYS